MGDELLQEVGERGAGPGDPAVGLEEPALALARQQRVAVVELADEVELLAGRLDRVEHPEARARHPRRHGGAGERADGEDVGEPGRDVLGDAQGHRGRGVDRAAEGDEAREALAAAKRGGLVAEHAALAVAAEVRVLARRLADAIDGVGDGQDVVGQRAARSRPPRARARRSRRPTGRRPGRGAFRRRSRTARRRRPRPPASSAAPGSPGRVWLLSPRRCSLAFASA